MSEIFKKSSLEKLSNPEQLDKAVVISSPVSWFALAGVFVVIASFVIWCFFGEISQTSTARGIITSPVGISTIYSAYTGRVKANLTKAGQQIKKGDILTEIIQSDGKTDYIYSAQDGMVSEILRKKGEKVYQGCELMKVTPKTDLCHVVVCYVPVQEAAQLRKNMKVIITSVNNGDECSIKAYIEAIDTGAATKEGMLNVAGKGNGVADELLNGGPVVAVICIPENEEDFYKCFGKTVANIQEINGTPVNVKIIIKESSPIEYMTGKKNCFMPDYILKEQPEGGFYD